MGKEPVEEIRGEENYMVNGFPNYMYWKYLWSYYIFFLGHIYYYPYNGRVLGILIFYYLSWYNNNINVITITKQPVPINGPSIA